MRKVQENQESAGAFDKRPDCGTSTIADHQIAFPVPGNGAVQGFSRAFADEDHATQEAST